MIFIILIRKYFFIDEQNRYKKLDRILYYWSSSWNKVRLYLKNMVYSIHSVVCSQIRQLRHRCISHLLQQCIFKGVLKIVCYLSNNQYRAETCFWVLHHISAHLHPAQSHWGPLEPLGGGQNSHQRPHRH